MTYTPSPIEVERRNRIRLTVAAYAYEIKGEEIMSDAAFDRLAQSIDRNMSTGYEVTDRFFREEFSAMTGMWIHKHPELKRVSDIYQHIRSY